MSGVRWADTSDEEDHKDDVEMPAPQVIITPVQVRLFIYIFMACLPALSVSAKSFLFT